MNPLKKIMRERNLTSDNISYLVDNKKCLCQYGKLQPLKYRKGNF